MPKSDALAIVATLSNNTADPVTSGLYYDLIMFEFARENWFVEAEIVALTKGQSEVDLDDAVSFPIVNILGLIYDNTELEGATKKQMEAIDPQWRDAIQYTRSFVVDDESVKSIALHPAPIFNSNPNLGSFGEPFGLDYPLYNLACFYSYAALEPQEPWYYLELVIALRILAMEFNRESDHTDMEFAGYCQQFSDLFKGKLE